MRKNLMCAAVILLMLLVTSLATTPSKATADYSKIGVRAGTWMCYLLYETPHGYPNQGSVNMVCIKNVTKGVVFSNSTVYRSGGGKYLIFDNAIDNVSKGEHWIWEFIIPANLSAGDPINQYSGATWKINETVDDFLAAGVNRTVNHLTLHNCLPTKSELMDIYWDKFTGVSVQLRIGNTSKPTHPYWYNVTLLATSLWNASSMVDGGLMPLSGSGARVPPSGGTPLLLAGIAVVAVLGVAAGYMLGRRGKRR